MMGRAMSDVLRRAMDAERLKDAAREAKERASGLRKISAIAFEFHRALARLDTAEVRAAIRIAEAMQAELARAAAAGMDPEAVLWEARLGVIVGLVAGFGSIISEVGAVMLVGGNIDGRTRVLTTAIVLETRQGHFDVALALGIILLALSFVSNFALVLLQHRTGAPS